MQSNQKPTELQFFYKFLEAKTALPIPNCYQ